MECGTLFPQREIHSNNLNQDEVSQQEPLTRTPSRVYQFAANHFAEVLCVAFAAATLYMAPIAFTVGLPVGFALGYGFEKTVLWLSNCYHELSVKQDPSPEEKKVLDYFLKRREEMKEGMCSRAQSPEEKSEIEKIATLADILQFLMRDKKVHLFWDRKYMMAQNVTCGVCLGSLFAKTHVVATYLFNFSAFSGGFFFGTFIYRKIRQ